MSNNDLAIRFFLQLAFIVATCRIVGLLAKRVGQPQVVAEMIAGVLMGPSLFGLLLPGVQGYLFPKTSMSIIYAVSQVGLVLYMFLIGLEFQGFADKVGLGSDFCIRRETFASRELFLR